MHSSVLLAAICSWLAISISVLLFTQALPDLVTLLT
jgi:hypothetical protein